MSISMLGAGLIGSGADAGLGLLSGAINRGANKKDQKELMQYQMGINKQMTDFNVMKQLEMWEKTGYVPTVDQMKRAGLNPALLYKGAGAGGSTQVSTSNQSIDAKANNFDMSGAMQMGLQMGLMKAQKENIEADTKQKLATAEKTSGVDTEATKKQIELIGALTDNEVVKKEINEQIKEQEYIETHIKTMSMNNIVALSKYQTEQAWEVLQGQVTQNKISRESANDQIEIIKQQRINLLIQKQVMLQGIELSKAQIDKIGAEIAQGWESLSIQDKNARLQGIKTQIETYYGGNLGKWKVMSEDQFNSLMKQIDMISEIGKEHFKK